MKILDILSEAVAQEDYDRFEQWKRDCKKADPNATFAGSIGIGAQAVNWIDPGNKVVGDWDGRTMTGEVYSTKSTVKEAMYGAYEVVEDPDAPQWLVKLDGVVKQQFPYTHRDTLDKQEERKNAIRWARSQYGVHTN